MAAHKSAISIGLIFVPVSLSKTTRETGISFNQLCKDDGSRVKYKKVCMKCGKEVSNDDIVKGFEIEDDAILAGLQKAKQPARMEIISLQPLVLLGGGHNPDGIDALAGMIERSGLPKMHAVLGMMKDKACEDMLRRLSECFDVVYTVTPDNPRAMPAEELAALALRYFDEAYPAASVEEAITAAKRGIGKLKGMCVCGSLYLAGEARKILLSDANG